MSSKRRRKKPVWDILRIVLPVLEGAVLLAIVVMVHTTGFKEGFPEAERSVVSAAGVKASAVDFQAGSGVDPEVVNAETSTAVTGEKNAAGAEASGGMASGGDEGTTADGAQDAVGISGAEEAAGSAAENAVMETADGSAEENTVTEEAAGAAAENMVMGAADGTDAGSAMMTADAELVEFIPAEKSAPDFHPHCVDSTAPSNLISFTEIQVDGNTLYDESEYSPAQTIEFGPGQEYTGVQGVITFRGNSFRDDPTFGRAVLKENKIQNLWSYNTGSLSYGDASWSGSGWTGQPLLVRWPKAAKAVMNMYDWAKEDDDLVEVIYACMDGYVYFLDMKTGKQTRDTLYLGWTFKGAGALDPRGYPIMYVGAGYDSNSGTARVFIVNLLDCSVMYTFGNNDPYSLRGSLSYFDSSALVDAETDTLIYPGENGILYLMKLNTQYDEAAGTLSIAPSPVVKWHYSGTRTDVYSYWLGMEDSIAVYKGYGFVADNGGNLMCIDLNTLQLVWVQDVLDDSNSTPVLAVEDDHLYLYISTSFHLGWRSDSTAQVPIWKIDAETGEIVWQTPYECYSEAALSGGVQSTIAVGKNSLSDYLYVTVSRTGGTYDGVLSCLNRRTGEIVWEHKAFYSWSSPFCIYDEDGNGKVIYCSCGGKMYLLDGFTGETFDSYDFGGTVIEASPAAFDSYVVVGTRGCQICGFQLS